MRWVFIESGVGVVWLGLYGLDSEGAHSVTWMRDGYNIDGDTIAVRCSKYRRLSDSGDKKC